MGSFPPWFAFDRFSQGWRLRRRTARAAPRAAGERTAAPKSLSSRGGPRTLEFRGQSGYLRIEVRIGGRNDDVRLPVRRLEGGELAIDERGRHEVIAAGSDPRAHQFAIRAEIDEAQPAADAGPQPLTVDSPQR